MRAIVSARRSRLFDVRGVNGRRRGLPGPQNAITRIISATFRTATHGVARRGTRRAASRADKRRRDPRGKSRHCLHKPSSTRSDSELSSSVLYGPPRLQTSHSLYAANTGADASASDRVARNRMSAVSWRSSRAVISDKDRYGDNNNTISAGVCSDIPRDHSVSDRGVKWDNSEIVTTSSSPQQLFATVTSGKDSLLLPKPKDSQIRVTTNHGHDSTVIHSIRPRKTVLQQGECFIADVQQESIQTTICDQVSIRRSDISTNRSRRLLKTRQSLCQLSLGGDRVNRHVIKNRKQKVSSRFKQNNHERSKPGIPFLDTQPSDQNNIQPSNRAKVRRVRFLPPAPSILTCWLLGQALLASTHPSSAVAAFSAEVPYPPLHDQTHTYKAELLRLRSSPLSHYNDSIAIFFSPPSIVNLRVNTRHRVFFNFTLKYRLPSVSKGSTIQDLDTQASAISATKSTRDTSEQSDQPVPGDTSTGLDPKHSAIPTTLTTSSFSTNVTTGKDISSVSSLSFKASSPSPVLDNQGPSGNSSTSDSSKGQPAQAQAPSDKYMVMIYSDDDRVARPVLTNNVNVQADEKGWYILMDVVADKQHNFSVEARHIGRVTMSVAVVEVNGDKRLPQAVQGVAASEYPVTAVRGERTADIVFNSSVAAIAIIISFGIGACTDTDSLKRQLKNPVALIIAFCCQFIIMPVLAFGLAMMLPLDKDIRFGFLSVACVPGGGLSHVAVIIAGGDAALSLTINLISVVAMLGTAPLWIFVLGRYFNTDAESALNPRTVPIYNFELCLVATFFAYAGGLAIKRIRPDVADAILMWLIKPCLLLASILYITLGVYINMYVFELINEYALLGAMLLPLCGCIIGAVTATICRQSYAFIKTIALETCSLNCLVVMVALRFTLPQPDADLAAMIPIWVMFTIPGLYVSLAISTRFKDTALHYWRNRNNKDNDMQSSSKAYSVSSSVVSPPGTTTLSAPLVVADCGDDDITISTTSNQKVTVL